MGTLLPKNLLKTTVLIATKYDKTISPIGTGFLFLFKNKFLLITCKHVAEKDNENLFIFFNLKDGRINSRSLSAIKKKYNLNWRFHESADIAAIIFEINLNADDIQLVPENLIDQYDNLDIGDDVFFLGYPMGITSKESAYPLVRTGVISTKFEKGIFLIDGNSYPGNSGGPVFLKPSIIDYSGSNIRIGAVRPPKLIGMIFENINYVDVAYSKQTDEPRVKFMENASLAKAYSVDKIIELLNSQKFLDYLSGNERP